MDNDDFGYSKITVETPMVDENGRKVLKKGKVTFGGMVTAVRTGFTKKGSAYGVVSIEDYYGAGELALFGEDWGNHNSKFIIGSSVYVEARLSQKYPGSTFVDFGIVSVQYMQDVKERNLRSLTISVDPTAISDDTVHNLATIIADNPGSTELYFLVRQTDGRGELSLRYSKGGVNIVNDLVMFIESDPALAYSVNM